MMLDIQKEVNKSLKNIVKSGKIEELINKELEGTIKSIVHDCLRDYSDFGKAIKEKLKSALNCTDISFPEYHQKMADYVIEAVDSFMAGDAKEQMQGQIKGFFKPLDYTEIKLSEIIEEFKKSIDSYDREDLSDEMTCIIEDEGSFARVYFDKEESKSKYDCEFCLALHTRDGKREVFNIKSGREDLKKNKMSILGCFERILFQLYSQKISIVIDYVDTELCFEEEY